MTIKAKQLNDPLADRLENAAAASSAGITLSGLHAQLNSMLRHSGLTKEEQVEFDNLKIEHDSENRKLKRAAFKALPAETRQMVIGLLMWQDQSAAISNISAPISDRYKELIDKNDYRSMFGSSYVTQAHDTYFPDQKSSLHINMPIPRGLNLEDLKEIHLEASLEEEVLNGES